MFACNPTFRPVLSAPAEVRYIHLWGGRGRGGSFFGTEHFLACLIRPSYFRGYFMRAVHSDIRESLWRDFKDRYEDKVERGLLNPAEFAINEGMMSVVHLPTGNSILSRGFRKSSKGRTAKLKSIAGATHVLIEEFEEIEEADFTQLDDSLRTTKSELRIICIFNPPKKNHWIIRTWYNLIESRIAGYYLAQPKTRENFLSIFSSYHANKANLNPTTIANFENYKITQPDYYYTVIRGLISEGAKGRIYSGWKPISNAAFNALPYSAYGCLDFGFSGDPVAFSMVKRHRNQRWVKELIYETGLLDADLIARLKAFGWGNKPIVADSADPKSIATLRAAGFNVIAARKGADSIRFGIKAVQGCTWHYTETSTNLQFEYQEYRWLLDTDKNLTTQPEDKHNHLLDGIRYGELTDPFGGGSIDY